MLSRLELLVDLLHGHGEAALATHSIAMPGYPLATAMAYATDERHRPIVLISRLAEHTRNLAADPRASLLVVKPLEGGEMARVSLVGELAPVDADPLLRDRYLRFHPEAERFLELGDFHFHRLEPRRVLVVGGFGKAGWLDGERLVDAPSLPLDVEKRLLEEAASLVPAGARMIGLDPYGADLLADGERRRVRFSVGAVVADAMLATLSRELSAG